jgi:hypothetical protein
VDATEAGEAAMANESQDKGFTVVDRRVGAEEEPKKEGEPSVKGPGWEMHEEQRPQLLPPMDFTTFCLSLASSAMIHLGDAPSPETGRAEKSLPLAKQTIDILVLLEEKTRNNLTPEETKLLQTLLYDLRLRYVQATGSK